MSHFPTALPSMHIFRIRRIIPVRFLLSTLLLIGGVVAVLGVTLIKAQVLGPKQFPTELALPSPLTPIATALTKSEAEFCDALNAQKAMTASDSAALESATPSAQPDMSYLIYSESIKSVCPWHASVMIAALSEAATDSATLADAEATESAKKLAIATAVPTPKPSVPPKPTIKPVATIVLTAKPTPIATPVPTLKPAAAVPTAPADLEALFAQHAATHGVDPIIMKKIAQCESGMRAEASNGPYGGMFQFLSATWVSNRRAMGKDTDPALRYNAAEAIETAAFKMGRDGYGAWPSCSRKALSSV